MKFIFAFVIIFCSFIFAYGQGGNELSPIVEREIAYKDWVYKNVQDGTDLNLRKFTSGKRLVLVVYFAPWCPNWKHDVGFVESMYEKYKSNGFGVIAVGEYDPVDSIKAHVAEYKLTFPVVWESDARTAKQTTLHYEYRKSVGDTRNWGSPWYVFLEVGKLESDGPVMTKKTSIVNGELIQPDAEKFIREKLGLAPAAGNLKLTSAEATEICDPAKPATPVLKPATKP